MNKIKAIAKHDCQVSLTISLDSLSLNSLFVKQGEVIEFEVYDFEKFDNPQVINVLGDTSVVFQYDNLYLMPTYSKDFDYEGDFPEKPIKIKAKEWWSSLSNNQKVDAMVKKYPKLTPDIINTDFSALDNYVEHSHNLRGLYLVNTQH